MLAGVARLAVMVPGSAFLETPADEPLEFPGLGPSPYSLDFWRDLQVNESTNIFILQFFLFQTKVLPVVRWCLASVECGVLHRMATQRDTADLLGRCSHFEHSIGKISRMSSRRASCANTVNRIM